MREAKFIGCKPEQIKYTALVEPNQQNGLKIPSLREFNPTNPVIDLSLVACFGKYDATYHSDFDKKVLATNYLIKFFSSDEKLLFVWEFLDEKQREYAYKRLLAELEVVVL